MTPETRRNVLRYGIAVDLVILATGAGMLLPPMPTVLLLLFGAAVLVSTWKGGWQGGLTALVLSAVALGGMFSFGAPAVALFAVAMAVAGGAVAAAMRARESSSLRVDESSSLRVAESPSLPVDESPAEEVSTTRRLDDSTTPADESARARELEAQLAREREEAEREKARLQEERDRAEQELQARLAREREEAEREKARLEEERVRLEAEREAAERARREAEERLAREREEAERVREEAERARRENEERAAREREEAERALQAKLEEEREAMRVRLEQQLAAERETLAKEAEARIEEAKRAAESTAARAAEAKPAPAPAPAPAPKVASPKIEGPGTSLLGTVTGWFRREPRTRPNLTTKRVATNGTKRSSTPPPPRRSAAPQPAKVRQPRLVLLERRRGTADTVLPKLRQRGIEVSVVERWVDAVDELLRMKPDAFLLDVEHPDFTKAHRTTMDKYSNLPIILTGRSNASAPASVRYAAFAVRPYDTEDLARLAQQAMSRPDELLAVQMLQRTPEPKPIPVAPAPAKSSAALKRPEPPAQPPIVVATKPGSNEEYEVQCYTCRVAFNAVESDWCSCLAKERTLVCTNCLSCFCKAPPAYKEKFWVEAPPRLFERKTTEARRQGGLTANPSPADVPRPLVLTVEDDEEIQAIVQRVCANLGYGFIYATNGQDGLELAREYRPNLILSDAFMPKLDGREMCRMLKDDPTLADTRMVVMTGLYTDTKYRSEALKRFRVDDYIAKPVAITDLINLLQKHLEGVTGLPVQDDLHALHRQDVADSMDALDDMSDMEDVPLSEVLAAPDSPQMQIAAAPAPARPDAYEVCCANCEKTFDATHAEWCRCVGRDNTLVCTHCGGCFCKAPAAYKERFWIDAPPSLFERKMIGSKRSLGLRANPPAGEVKRPLILLVEDDENVQLIVRTVVTTMGFGFVVGANGQEGLTLAREYGPDLILSDAFMPKLDGREMCRLLKEDPSTARSKAIIMTGLYTDRKYRNEALDYFKVDDYVAKPLAVDDLIKLFKKHLPQEVATAH